MGIIFISHTPDRTLMVAMAIGKTGRFTESGQLALVENIYDEEACEEPA